MSDTSAPPLQVFAPAKINLFLHVTGRRADGLHLLQSLFVFASVGDCLSVQPSVDTTPDISLDIIGPFAVELIGPGAGDGGNNSDNIIIRAAEALKSFVGDKSLTARLRLQKNLPVAAGIGGGSADAAAALRLLQAFWGQDISQAEMMALALSLGADVPACLDGRASWVEGVGEEVAPVADFSPQDCVLVNPLVDVPTPEVFRRLVESGQPFSQAIPRWPIEGNEDGAESGSGEGGGQVGLLEFLNGTRNDLANAALSIAPQIADVLGQLDAASGCRMARMSGSGATCFGLFSDAPSAARAAVEIKATNPGWWVAPASLGSGDGSVSGKASDTNEKALAF